jgi:hypothetical protein
VIIFLSSARRESNLRRTRTGQSDNISGQQMYTITVQR